MECLDDITNYQWHLECWIFDFILILTIRYWIVENEKNNFLGGAEVDSEPKCDPNGKFNYPCTMVHEDWIFCIVVYFKQKRRRKDSWFINTVIDNGFENGLFTKYGTNINAVENDLFCAIIAPHTISVGDIFGDI